MKKVILTCAMGVALFATQFAKAQAIRDGAVVPVSVNLNEVLRITLTQGGNIEFTFNSIEDYRDGMGNAPSSYYNTNFTIAASRRWELSYGAEAATFIGTDNPANTLALNNVGFALTETGSHTPGTEILSVPTNDFTALDVTALQAYPVVLITDGGNATANAGDGTENAFTMAWRCGTGPADNLVSTAPTLMNGTSILDQLASPEADRYVVNVLFELASL